MIQEFAQVMMDRLKTYYAGLLGPPNAIGTFYMFTEPEMGKRNYPYILIHPGRSTETMLTTSAPQIEAFYLVECVDMYTGATQDQSAPQLFHQRPMQLGDSVKEIHRNDDTVRNLCLDFRAVRTETKIAEGQDMQELRQQVEIRVIFNSDGAVYGYSLYGFSIYG